jgi:hypothetical protein
MDLYGLRPTMALYGLMERLLNISIARIIQKLPADQMGFVYCDHRNAVWACTDKGLARLDAKPADGDAKY